MASCFAESFEFEMLCEPKLKGSGSFGDIMAINGPFWTGFRCAYGAYRLEAGEDANNACVTYYAESVCALDADGKEIEGTKKGGKEAEVHHFITTNKDGKIIKWQQDFYQLATWMRAGNPAGTPPPWQGRKL